MNPRDKEIIKQAKEKVWSVIFGEVNKPKPTVSKPISKPLPPLNEGKKDSKPSIFGNWGKWEDKQGLPPLTQKDIENAGKSCKDGKCPR